MEQSVHPPGGARALVATMLMVAPESVDADTSLRAIDNSLSGARLRLGLKRLGIEFNSPKVPATFGELERVLAGSGSTSAPAVATEIKALPVPSPAAAGARIGHDLQDLESMPDTVDFWSHEFYLGSFSPAELAYAVVQSVPKQSLAGFWAAKEALRKCDPAFVPVEFTQLTVAHRSDGSPYFSFQSNGDRVSLQHSVSISHARNTASAVVLAPGS
jgi:phosphopantetheine--protein transferase-like protein